MLQCEGYFRFSSSQIDRGTLLRLDGSRLCKGCEVRRRSPFVDFGAPYVADDL